MSLEPGGQDGKVRVLLIEDDPGDADLLRVVLSDQRDPSFEIEQVGTIQRGLEYLAKGSVEVVLLDLGLPDSQGMETFARVYTRFPGVPIVVLSGLEDESLALGAVRKGAQDYLIKAKVGQAGGAMLSRVLRYAIARKKAQEELGKAYRELKETQRQLIQAEKLEALGRFSIGLAHEVKNPLGIILGGVEYLERKVSKTDTDTQTVIEMIKNSVERADTTVKNLLRFASPSQLKIERTQPDVLAREALSLMKYRALLEDIAIETDFSQEDDLWISVDKNQILQVLFNVLMNAVEAMPQGGRIAVKTYPVHSSDKLFCAIEISDTGEGISKKDLNRVFEPFFTTKRERKGTGLGLSISKRIAQNHSGDLTVESELGEGTTVKVVLPMAKRRGS